MGRVFAFFNVLPLQPTPASSKSSMSPKLEVIFLTELGAFLEELVLVYSSDKCVSTQHTP